MGVDEKHHIELLSAFYMWDWSRGNMSKLDGAVDWCFSGSKSQAEANRPNEAGGPAVTCFVVPGSWPKLSFLLHHHRARLTRPRGYCEISLGHHVLKA